MIRKFRRRLMWGLPSLLLLLAAACTQAVSVKEIVDHPRDYADKQVTVEGEVKEVFGLLVVRYFTLQDKGAEIGVVTERPLPQRGEHIRVTGTVREAFALGDRTSLVLIEASDKQDSAKP